MLIVFFAMPTLADKIQGRQREILQRLANGEKRSAIAADLEISIDTLNSYVKRLYARLGAHTAAQALNNFLRSKLSQPSLF